MATAVVNVIFINEYTRVDKSSEPVPLAVSGSAVPEASEPLGGVVLVGALDWTVL